MSMSGYSGSSLQGNSSSLIFQIVVHLCQKLRSFDTICLDIFLESVCIENLYIKMMQTYLI